MIEHRAATQKLAVEGLNLNGWIDGAEQLLSERHRGNTNWMAFNDARWAAIVAMIMHGDPEQAFEESKRRFSEASPEVLNALAWHERPLWLDDLMARGTGASGA